MAKKDDSRLVYSSEHGRICTGCGKPTASCICRKKSVTEGGDGIVRVRREKSGRGGKTVIVISGVPGSADDLRSLCTELKRRCGTGGTVKDGVIEIQGDHRDTLLADLEKRGFRVKAAGG
ncbi:translation initiation factor Sui1 [Geobacter sp. DSM 9736]|uniref:translation initiation factor Sui1 n=1 Tax=Geobacter sp. DSM 9736 TaxID=1277350 RepID=UPI000B501775|nr:translation initiation factor Sui1 [Geobacter sp. DSM 9736]SNB47986.1 translation initiation factor 1 (eIF-1/SUI1) [Geobacter sp. DSM 9736]